MREINFVEDMKNTMPDLKLRFFTFSKLFHFASDELDQLPRQHPGFTICLSLNCHREDMDVV